MLCFGKVTEGDCECGLDKGILQIAGVILSRQLLQKSSRETKGLKLF